MAEVKMPVKTLVEPRRRIKNPVPAEGENGVFSQTWWPICLSTEVTTGKLVGKSFLDGRVVVYRGQNGIAKVMSAYCPHLGADLALGAVVQNNLQCFFHRFEYDQEGHCVKTGIGDPPPPRACLYAFPTQEKYGVVWAFNGDAPSFDIPSFDYPEDELLIRTIPFGRTMGADGQVFSCNTSDFVHLMVVHGVKLKSREIARLTPFSQEWRYSLNHWNDVPTEFRVGIFGTNIFLQNSEFDGRYGAVLVPFSCPRPGNHEAYWITAVRKGDGSEESNRLQRQWLDDFERLELDFGAQDVDVLNSIHFMPGTLTKSDEYLAKFLDYLRAFPRVHPSADFIN